MFTNNGANIRRMKERLAELQVQAERVATETTIQPAETEVDGVQIIRNLEENRLQLVFSGKPSAEVRALLKQRGFHWSPSQKAWQRQLNNAAEYAAAGVLQAISAADK